MWTITAYLWAAFTKGTICTVVSCHLRLQFASQIDLAASLTSSAPGEFNSLLCPHANESDTHSPPRGCIVIVEPVQPCLLQFICYCGWQQRRLTIQTAGVDIIDPTWKHYWETSSGTISGTTLTLSKSRNDISDPFNIHLQSWITDSLPREWMMSESNEASSQCDSDNNHNPAFF